MHILVLMASVLGGAAFWWYRMKYVSQAGAEVVDAVGRARGKMRRNKMRNQAEASPVAAIDHPIIAATTLLAGLTTSHPMTPAQQDVLRGQIEKIASGELLEEAVVYAQWVQTQPLDNRKATLMLCQKLNDWLSPSERKELVDMINVMGKNDRITLNAPMLELAVRKLSA